jgi:hypothetical protein
MNRLARASGIAVSALTAATATIMLLVPGSARFEFPEATTGASGGAVTSGATAPGGGGQPAVGHGLTMNGSGSPSRLPTAKAGPGGLHSTGGHDSLSGRSRRPAPPSPSVHLPVVTAVPGPAGTIGDSHAGCLRGYVWRQAYAGDYVCVTPATRSRAAADNAAAADRIASAAAHGAGTCRHGYVWRQVVPDDHVCVTAATRAEAAGDNAQANNRAALLSLWLTDWSGPARPIQGSCSAGTCPASAGRWDGPGFQINGDHFNVGPVRLQIRRADGAVLWTATVTATAVPGFAGGALYARSPFADCTDVPHTSRNDYAIAYDTVSGHWSDKVPLDPDCAFP